MRVFVLPFLLAVAVAVPAEAADKGFVRGLGGVTFGGETAPVFGGGAGFRISDNLSFTVELGQMRNIADADLLDAVELAEDAANRVLPFDVEIDVEARAFYGLAGIRYDMAGGNFRPYVVAGGGFAQLTMELDANVGGFDLPGFVDDAIGLEEETKGMIGLGAGIALDMSDAVGIDLGYRYNRVLTEDGINVNMVYGALRFEF